MELNLGENDKGLNIDQEWLEKRLEKQEARNQNIVYAVLVVSFFVFLSIAVEVVIFHTSEDDGIIQAEQYYYDMGVIREDINQLDIKLDTRNYNQKN